MAKKFYGGLHILGYFVIHADANCSMSVCCPMTNIPTFGPMCWAAVPRSEGSRIVMIIRFANLKTEEINCISNTMDYLNQSVLLLLLSLAIS